MSLDRGLKYFILSKLLWNRFKSGDE